MSDDKERISINVSIDEDLDTVPENSDKIDVLAQELATIRQSAKKIAIIGSRNLTITHQQIIEMLATTLVKAGNTIITSGGSQGTNAAAIRGAMKANPDKLTIILPQTIGQQPSDVQDQLIGVKNIVEHPDRAMMTLADASRICNKEIVDDCQQIICFLSHSSNTLHQAVQHAEESHKIVTVFYLD
ncbi:DNA-processing protein DprA [bacterium]|nr:DNA-processing protein DprA [bacterium]